MGEAFEGADIVELLGLLHTQPGQNGDLDLALAGVAGVILQDFNRHNLIRPMLPTLYNLAKGPAAQELEHLIPRSRRQ